MYRSLQPRLIVDTAEALHRRIAERFPDSGLSSVAGELVDVSREAEALSNWLDKPNYWIRGGVVLAVVLIVVLVAGAFHSLDLNVSLFSSISDFLQGLESAINDFVFLGLAIFFLATGETRLKRRRALEALHVLRSMAHIIDMHQLTKDPEQFHPETSLTPSSPKRLMTSFELTRYLDYCSELLAILSKVAAVYVQRFNDPVTISAVNEIEDLTTGLSRKIWQKLMILERITTAEEDRKIVAAGSDINNRREPPAPAQVS
ncbi:MAG TPA: hypothetical protein DCY13_15875 [Verrucomicrobiales bacterium]|nr:hypothetical protein [Verrucomicrobiales bacterium]